MDLMWLNSHQQKFNTDSRHLCPMNPTWEYSNKTQDGLTPTLLSRQHSGSPSCREQLCDWTILYKNGPALAITLKFPPSLTRLPQKNSSSPQGRGVPDSWMS